MLLLLRLNPLAVGVGIQLSHMYLTRNNTSLNPLAVGVGIQLG